MPTRQQKNPLLKNATIGDVLGMMQQLARSFEARLAAAVKPAVSIHPSPEQVAAAEALFAAQHPEIVDDAENVEGAPTEGL